MNTQWIPGYGERYSITKDGIVTSFVMKKPKVLKWKLGTDGYPRVALALGDGSSSKWLLVHRLILLSWVGPCPEGMEGRHLNGKPLEPHLDYLSWSTHSENLRDKRAHGTDYLVNRTHCPKGHEYNAINTRYRTDIGRIGQRECKPCNKETKRRSRQKGGPLTLA